MSDRTATQRYASLRAAAILVTILLAILVWYALDVFLLTFAGVLGAIALHAPAEWMSRIAPWSYRMSLTIVLLALAAAVGLFVWLLASSVIREIQELQESLPRALDNVEQWARQTFGRSALEQAKAQSQELELNKNMASGAAQALSISVGALGGAIIVGFVSLFLAYEPGVYRRGALLLLPERHVAQGEALLSEMASVLRRWLAGKLFSMAVVGVLTWAGLSLLGIPAALALAILTALLAFIPNIGPIVSVAPPALLATLQGPEQVLYVALLYLAIQTVESYLLTPLVQRQAVALPPGLIIIAQVLLGVLAGGLGVLLATPLTACSLVLVKRLYVEGFLGKRVDGDS